MLSRLQELAKPKEVKDVWNLSRSLFKYSCGRVSEIWHRPPDLYSIMPSERILQLAEPRQYLDIYLKQRPRSSAQWTVSPPAIHCNASPRILLLSQPRPLNPYFVLPREAETQVSLSSKRASASLRTERLAQPVVKNCIVYYDNRCVEAPIRRVNPAALQAVASPRVVELAKAKTLPSECAPDRSAMWPVSSAAKNAVATSRLEELAMPPKRAPTFLVQFDPDAFVVKDAAKNALCSDRLKQLSQPVKR
nr:PREDICTED: testicular haploid expressed gene protein-like [Anolis carolinensis]|eukprot:XP_008114863.1 PREDICTED: testicular haploid expressed gene protein-like [Anolis carolinensis]